MTWIWACDIVTSVQLGPQLAYALTANKNFNGMLSKDKKQKVIKKFQTHEGDTGSSEVQIAILSAEIDELAEHLNIHHKDHSSRRGLLRKVGERRRLMRYLQKENPTSFEALGKKLRLKQVKELARTAVPAAAGESLGEESDEATDAA